MNVSYKAMHAIQQAIDEVDNVRSLLAAINVKGANKKLIDAVVVKMSDLHEDIDVLDAEIALFVIVEGERRPKEIAAKNESVFVDEVNRLKKLGLDTKQR